MRSAHKIGQVSVAQAVAAAGLVDTETLNEVVEEHQTGGDPNGVEDHDAGARVER